MPGRGRTAALVGVVLLGMGVVPAWGQSMPSQNEALALAYPEADSFERRTAFLSEEEAARLEEVSRSAVQRVVTHYVALRRGEALGVAYFDAHRVRTLREVLMVALDEAGAVLRIEVLSFAEPREYLAPAGWLDLFQGWSDPDGGALRRDVPNITGATLTSRAVTDAVARVLALHAEIGPEMGEAR